MRKQGTGYPTITKTLNNEGILPPKVYYLEKVGKDSFRIRNRCWIITTVAMMLKVERGARGKPYKFGEVFAPFQTTKKPILRPACLR